MIEPGVFRSNVYRDIYINLNQPRTITLYLLRRGLESYNYNPFFSLSLSPPNSLPTMDVENNLKHQWACSSIQVRSSVPLIQFYSHPLSRHSRRL